MSEKFKGTVFQNNKDGVETRPDYTGQIVLNDKTLSLALWLRTDKNNKKYFSISAQYKE
nr:MAG TPA: hypothetical protein [Caudoviricetes sp.]